MSDQQLEHAGEEGERGEGGGLVGQSTQQQLAAVRVRASNDPIGRAVT